jgi:hypothetical protein
MILFLDVTGYNMTFFRYFRKHFVDCFWFKTFRKLDNLENYHFFENHKLPLVIKIPKICISYFCPVFVTEQLCHIYLCVKTVLKTRVSADYHFFVDAVY